MQSPGVKIGSLTHGSMDGSSEDEVLGDRALVGGCGKGRTRVLLLVFCALPCSVQMVACELLPSLKLVCQRGDRDASLRRGGDLSSLDAS